MLGPLEQCRENTLDAALLCSFRAGSDLICESPDWVEELCQFDIVSDTCLPAPCYLNSDKVFLLLGDQYHNPEEGFKPGT